MILHLKAQDIVRAVTGRIVVVDDQILLNLRTISSANHCTITWPTPGHQGCRATGGREVKLSRKKNRKL